MEILSLTPLTEVDRKLGRPKGSVAKIRARHHTIAKFLAKGMNFRQVAELIGMTPAGVRAWADNAANAELIAEYAEEYSAAVDTFLEERVRNQNHIAFLASTMALEQLQAAHAAGEEVPIEKLVKLMANADDRTGLGRQETRVNLNADVGERLDKARAASKAIAQARDAGPAQVLKLVRRV
jgi:predicted transcriptional regulator